MCGVESSSVNNSGLSGSSWKSCEREKDGVCEKGRLLAELGMEMANIFKHFFRKYMFIILFSSNMTRLPNTVVAIALCYPYKFGKNSFCEVLHTGCDFVVLNLCCQSVAGVIVFILPSLSHMTSRNWVNTGLNAGRDGKNTVLS